MNTLRNHESLILVFSQHPPQLLHRLIIKILFLGQITFDQVRPVTTPLRSQHQRLADIPYRQGVRENRQAIRFLQGQWTHPAISIQETTPDLVGQNDWAPSRLYYT